MSEPTGTAVTAPAEAVGKLPAGLEAALSQQKAMNLVAAKLAELNWGQKLDLVTRRAVADWGNRHQVDVTTEIDVLGGKVYLNAAFYLRKLGELVRSGVVDYAVADYIQADARLAKIGTPQSAEEDERRTMERIKWGVPEAAAAACAFRVKLKVLSREIVGVNWCGGGTRKSDPVGDAEPTKTAASRAARRAMRMLVSHIASASQAIMAAEAEAVQVGIVIDEETQKVEAQAVEASLVGRRPVRALTTGEYAGDPSPEGTDARD